MILKLGDWFLELELENEVEELHISRVLREMWAIELQTKHCLCLCSQRLLMIEKGCQAQTHLLSYSHKRKINI